MESSSGDGSTEVASKHAEGAQKLSYCLVELTVGSSKLTDSGASGVSAVVIGKVKQAINGYRR